MGVRVRVRELGAYQECGELRLVRGGAGRRAYAYAAAPSGCGERVHGGGRGGERVHGGASAAARGGWRRGGAHRAVVAPWWRLQRGLHASLRGEPGRRRRGRVLRRRDELRPAAPAEGEVSAGGVQIEAAVNTG
jgi:hypothetical protein